MRAPLLLVLLCAGCPAKYVYAPLVALPKQAAPLTVVHDVRVFTATGPDALEHQDVTFTVDQITSIVPTGSALPASARVIEGEGRTLLPGYIDFHVHLAASMSPPWAPALPDSNHVGQALLYSGVTTGYDVGGGLDDLEPLAKAQEAGTWLGPRFTYAGKLITPINGYPASYVREGLPWPVSEYAAHLFATEVGTEAEAVAAVEERVRRGAKHIKVAVAQVPLDGAVFSRELLEAIVKTSHAHGLKVVAHIDTAEHALLAAHAGVDALMHGVHLGELTVAQAQELHSLGTVVAPTLDVWDRLDRIAQFTWQPTELEKRIEPPESLAPFSPEVARVEAPKLAPKLYAWVQQLQADGAHRAEAVKRLYEAGVPVFAGSDASGSVACVPGGAYLDELRLLSEAGLPNADVLLGATSRPAHFINPNADYGTLEVGKRADLVLVEGNPLLDITATSHIVAVVKGGAVLERLR